MTVAGAPNPAVASSGVVWSDRFEEDCAAGAVATTVPAVGGAGEVERVRRTVLDVERVISVDHGEARLRPMVQPGWGRCALLYDAAPLRCGQAALLQVLPAHVGSETVDPWPSVPNLLYNHLLNTRDEAPLARLRRVGRGRRRAPRVRLGRQLRRVVAHNRARRRRGPQAESLAVGLLGRDLATSGLGGGHGFVVRAREAVNGDLCASVGGELVVVAEALANVPLSLVVLKRAQGVLLGMVEGGDGDDRFRPLAIDVGERSPLRPGVHQAVSGQIGWCADARVQLMAVRDLADASVWSTTAAFADALVGGGPLATEGPSSPAVGATCAWQVLGAPIERSPDGARTVDAAVASLALGGELEAGLLHVLIEPGGSGGVAVRAAPDGDGLFVWFGAERFVVERRVEGRREQLAERVVPGAAAVRSLQLLDRGDVVAVVLDGVVLATVTGEHLAATGGRHVGLAGSPAFPLRGVRDWEVHPRTAPLPAGLGLRRAARPLADARSAGAVDTFDGAPGPLEGRTVPGLGTWARTIGSRRFLVQDGATPEPLANQPARWRRTRGFLEAAGHRSAYTVAWADETGCAAEIDVVPPGSAAGHGERGRAGLLVWQDPDNWLIAATWLDDAYAGTSISTFACLDGREELYEAVWTNVGRRISWGVPYRLALRLAGGTYEVDLDGATVLHRRLHDIDARFERLVVRRVGIVTNWEFGDDTGSCFRRFAVAPVTLEPA